MNIALAIILDGDKALIGEIKPEKLSDYDGLRYTFPCESVQDKENAEKELIEEVKRQTNLDIKVMRKIGERIHPSTKNHTYYFHCEKNSEQTLSIPKDIDAESFTWIDVDKLQTYMPTLFEGVKDYLDKNR
ncbi:MAG: NUDIX domain-containing protein [Patescibacteria group bacterium]